MTKPFVAARIPQNIADKLQSHCKKEGIGKTDVIVNALAQYLGCSIENPIETKAIDRLTVLEEKVAKLETTIQRQSEETDNWPDNKSVKQLTLDDNKSDKNPILDPLETLQGSFDNRNDNENALVTTDVIKLTGITRAKLDYAHKTGKLPYVINGYIIKSKLGHGKTKSGKRAALWEVKKTDNTSDK